MGQLVDVVEETHVEQIVAPVQTARLEIAAPIAAALPAVAQVHAQPIAPIAAPAVAEVHAQPIAPVAPIAPYAAGNLVAHPNGAVVPANTAEVAAAISEHLRHFVTK